MPNDYLPEFYVLIPARMESTRLPNKMIADINGLPLIIRTAQQAQKSNAKKVVVATDHPEIKHLCLTNNIDVVMTSAKHETGTDRIAEAARILDLSPESTIINVQGDEPLIDPEIINDLAKFRLDKNANIATCAHPIIKSYEVFNHNTVKVVLDKFSNALYFSRSAIPFYRDNIITSNNKANTTTFIPPTDFAILRHIGIYAYTIDFLSTYINLPKTQLEELERLEQLRALYHGYKIAVLVIKQTPESGVDSYEDLTRIRKLYI